MHIVALAVLAAVVRALAQGRCTICSCDFHARTLLLTSAFSSLGFALLRAPISVLVDLLCATCHNNHIFFEQRNLADPADMRRQFLSLDDIRLDVLVFAHEYPPTSATLNLSPPF